MSGKSEPSNSLKDNKLFAQRSKQLESSDDGSDSSSSEEDSSDDQITSNPGRIKNLAGFFTAQSVESNKTFGKKRLQVDDGPDSSVLAQSDEPEVISRVDDQHTDHHEPIIVIDEGHAKNLASLFQNKSRVAPVVAKKTFRINAELLDANPDANSSDLLKGDEEKSVEDVPQVSLQSRRINYLAETLATKRDKSDSVPQRGKIKFDRPSVIELATKKPTSVDDVNPPKRSRSPKPEPTEPEGNRRRSMAERWQQQQLEQEKELQSSRSDGGKTKPAWLIELETTKDQEPTVYENEPEVRDDVIRADDEQPDVISAQCTRKMRQLWSSIEQVGIKNKEDIASHETVLKSKQSATAASKSKSTEESTESDDSDDDDDDDDDDDEDDEDDDSDDSDEDDNKSKSVVKKCDESKMPAQAKDVQSVGVARTNLVNVDGSGIVLAGASLLHIPKNKGRRV